VLVTATSSTEPLVESEWLAPGIHVTAVGADDPWKCELAPECLSRADRVVVDSRRTATIYGEFARALAAGALEPGRSYPELGEVLTGQAPGRLRKTEITVCKLVGLGVQDLAAAEVALERLEAGVVPPTPPSGASDLT
jgi:ornithine cyclodeaminase